MSGIRTNFLRDHFHLAQGLFCGAVRQVRARLKNPLYSVEEYLETLSRQGLAATVAAL